MVDYDMLELNQVGKRRQILRDRILTFIKNSTDEKYEALSPIEKRSITNDKIYKFDDPQLIEMARKIYKPNTPKEWYE